MFDSVPGNRQTSGGPSVARPWSGTMTPPMDLHLVDVSFQLAQQGGGQSSGAGSILFLLPLIAIFYFLIMRPQQKRVKEQRALLSAVKQGDRVVAAGGIVGTVRRVEDDTLHLQVADNVVIKVDKGSVSKRLSE